MPARNILVLDSSDSAINFALVNEAHSQFTLNGRAENLGSRDAVLNWQRGGEHDSLMLANGDHRAAFNQILAQVQSACGGKLNAVGHRVAHGAERFTCATLLEPPVLQVIRAAARLEPQHTPGNLLGIEAALNLLPKLPHVAVFDTAFHQTLPEAAYRYAIADELYRQHGVRRYGFRGTSHRYVSHRGAEMAGLSVGDSSWLTAHLGSHSSTCAIVNGQSRDTSTGLSALEGLPGATGSGDIDPALALYLHTRLGWDSAQLDVAMHHQSGLLGLSGGLSGDMRKLEQARDQGHAGATLAIEVFCYRVAKSLAAMSCALEQLDGLIFTGGIGENSPLIRAKIVGHLKLLNLALDKEANARCIRGVAGPIHAYARPRVLVIPANEERQIALDTLALIN